MSTAPEFDARRLRHGEEVLRVEDLTVEFVTDDGVVHAVTDLSYTLHAGETLAILGESGSGKSVGVQAVMGLVPSPPGRVPRGRVLYEGTDLVSAPAGHLRGVRGSEIAMIFQDPLTSLNPVYKVGWQLAETLRIHGRASRKEAKEQAVELLAKVGVPNPRERANQFPHQYSGGMRQRAMIAMALALRPKVLIADEPTTALDVTVQAQIMELLSELQDETGMGLILITHDLGVVARVADTVLVMYAGRTVETGTADDFYSRPGHPYSRGLMASVPRLTGGGETLHTIEGAPPSLVHLPAGCSFHPRCPYAIPACRDQVPPLIPVEGRSGTAACIRIDEVLS